MSGKNSRYNPTVDEFHPVRGISSNGVNGAKSVARRLPLGKRVLFSLTTVGAAVGLLALAAELGLRLFAPAPAFAASLNLHTYLNTRREPDLHGVASPIRHTTNKWGMRGSDPPVGRDWEEATTIVDIGGSTTQCFYLDDTRAWPYVMEQALRRNAHNVWVGNAGQDGHSTCGHLAMMDRVISAVRPDIVLFLVGINDLSLSLNDNWATGNGYDDNMTREALGPPRSPTLNRILDHSRLAHRLYLLKQVHLDGAVVRTVRYRSTIPSDPLPGPEGPLPADIYEVLTSLPLFRANVLSLIRTARQLGITPVFLTQPLLFTDNQRWRKIRARPFWIPDEPSIISGATLARLLGRFNQELSAICDQQGVACFDLAGQVPHSEEFFYDMVHFNDAGARLVGTKTAAFLEAHCLSAPAASPP